MARYRTYKNGIHGHRYKGFYVVKSEEGKGSKNYSIVDDERNVIKADLKDYWDCEWEIDKMTSPPDLLELLQSLYNEELYMLSRFFVELMEKENREGLTRDEQEFFSWVKKIRARKADGKPY